MKTSTHHKQNFGLYIILGCAMVRFCHPQEAREFTLLALVCCVSERLLATPSELRGLINSFPAFYH